MCRAATWTWSEAGFDDATLLSRKPRAGTGHIGEEMEHNGEGILEGLAAQAVRTGCDALQVEYKDGYEEVFAFRGALGVGIAHLPSSGPEAEALRRELCAMGRRKRAMMLEGQKYEARCHAFDSFGGTAYRLELRRKD